MKVTGLYCNGERQAADAKHGRILRVGRDIKQALTDISFLYTLQTLQSSNLCKQGVIHNVSLFDYSYAGPIDSTMCQFDHVTNQLDPSP